MEKMQLRMIAILDQSKVSWGDLADTINTPANMIRQLSNNFKEASMVLGQLFMPFLTSILPKSNGVVIALKNLFVTIAGFLGINIDLDSVGSGANESLEDIYDLQEGMDEATDSAKKLKNQLQGFDKLNNLTTANASNVNGAIGGTIDLSSQIQKSTEEYQKAWNEAYANMENKAQEFAKNIEKALSPIKRIFENLVIGDVFVVGQDVGRLVVDINNFLSRAIENVDWDKVGTDFGSGARPRLTPDLLQPVLQGWRPSPDRTGKGPNPDPYRYEKHPGGDQTYHGSSKLGNDRCDPT